MELSFKGSASKPFKLNGIAKDITVKDLKALCEAECSLAPERQRLFYKGKLLADEQTLEACNINDRATLFLVKGVAAAGEPAAEASSSEGPKVDEEPAVSVPCAGGCGFFGSSRTENYCSKCFNEKRKKEEEEESKSKAAGSQEEKPSEEDAAKKEEDCEAKEEEPKRAEQTDTTRCWVCNKKIGLMGFQCKCGYYFCAKHRYAEDHDCSYDHKEKGRELLRQNNPAITGN